MVKFKNKNKNNIYTQYISGLFCYIMKTLILAFKNPYQSNLIQKAALTGERLVSF